MFLRHQAELINEVSLEYPIIMSTENFVLDGMHRVSKALLKGNPKISAVQFTKTPVSDFNPDYVLELRDEPLKCNETGTYREEA